MEVFTLLESLEEILESSSKVPFSTKVMVDAGEKWVKEERQRIISDAELEAQKVLKETEGKIINLIDEHEITKQALAQKEEIIENANKVSKEISDGTREYADNVLERVENVLREAMDIVHVDQEKALNKALSLIVFLVEFL